MPKHGIVVLVALGLLLGTISLETLKISKLNTTIAELSTENSILDQTLKDEQSKFKYTLDRLQNELSKYTLDAGAYQCAVSCKSKAIDEKAKEEESRINKELQLDSSSDNQLDIARRVLNEFNRNNKD